ncbi:hypothetical protein, variant [Aphanomyces astaci]|uniref:Uncharacterized protein n=1 Tax=Aphanomyces astaci TaxID=112090 RepID=W4GBC8_APHAT|nr:hypothetical protein, variant [Aphanomyces astaci]ETV76263.1 hypothetical protein, variant [Aphanomyces astaci]|eukprot:XP_009834388.1 hypothetical protein, variant [Aphanomyces astaci]
MLFSTTNAPTLRIGRWYSHVIIKVTRHQSSKHVVVNGRSKSSLYTITVRHPTSQAVIATLHKSDFDFEQLRDRCKAALRHGHKCNALCPWYYVDMSEHMPKRRLFTSPCSRYAVGLHVKIYQDLFDHTLAFLQCPDTQACPIAAQRAPRRPLPRRRSRILRRTRPMPCRATVDGQFAVFVAMVFYPDDPRCCLVAIHSTMNALSRH